MHYNLFLYFLSICYIVPTLVENSIFLCTCTYRHDAVLLCLMAELQACLGNVKIFADLDGKRASVLPQFYLLY